MSSQVLVNTVTADVWVQKHQAISTHSPDSTSIVPNLYHKIWSFLMRSHIGTKIDVFGKNDPVIRRLT